AACLGAHGMTPADATVAPRVLDGPFTTTPASELTPLPATVDLVKTQVDALLLATPSYHGLPEPDRRRLGDGLVRIAAYAAECVRDLCWQSGRLGQTPVVRRREWLGPAASSRELAAKPSRALAAAPEAPAPRAAGQIGRITRETLKAVAFPVF